MFFRCTRGCVSRVRRTKVGLFEAPYSKYLLLDCFVLFFVTILLVIVRKEFRARRIFRTMKEVDDYMPVNCSVQLLSIFRNLISENMNFIKIDRG